MLIRRPDDIAGSEITSEAVFHSRRRFIRNLSVAGGGLLMAGAGPGQATVLDTDTLTPEPIVTGYNNFYEFGPDKTDPARYAHELTTDPWEVKVSGKAARTGTFPLGEILEGLVAEERVYRFRCVEAWSMVVPWQGIPLSAILDRFKPDNSARYVEFKTLYRPSEMPGQRSRFSAIDWPYVEGLRMDEAYHPLSIMAVGVYGKPLPNQNGAPWRLIVPWKYGFKSVKSIVSIRFTSREPVNTWQALAPDEYGFYANVNPAVAHPRWSQASERRLPSTLFEPNRRPTLPFNGYAEQVASLYSGMDLTRYY